MATVHKCEKCGSTNLVNNGIKILASGLKKQKVKCKDCGKNGGFVIDEKRKDKIDTINREFVESVDHLKSAKKYVITSAQNDTTTDTEFLGALKKYCDFNEAQLIVIPIRYLNPTAFKRPSHNTWDSELIPYMMDKTLDLGPFKILGNLKIQATAQSPLTGLEPLTQGVTTILGHAQVQMKSLPRMKGDDPIILTTTGTVSNCNYSDTKIGYISQFHHTKGAVVVEFDSKHEDLFHIRHLIADDDSSFIDLGVQYTSDSYYPAETLGLVLGDEHAWFADPDVFDATHGDGGIVDTLRPEVLIRHDIFDGYSVSHHHENNFFVKYKKMHQRMTLASELAQCIEYIEGTTPEYTTSVIVNSNHNSHLMKWLQEPRSSMDIDNAFMHSVLKAKVLDAIHQTGSIPDAFSLYVKEELAHNDRIVVHDSDESFMVGPIEISMHGDKGPNGSRGSARGLSRLPQKSVIGHSHTPCIERGCYQVGTSTGFNLEYAKGPTSWMNTHCAIYANGKRQLINVLRGRWRT